MGLPTLEFAAIMEDGQTDATVVSASNSGVNRIIHARMVFAKNILQEETTNGMVLPTAISNNLKNVTCSFDVSCGK